MPASLSEVELFLIICSFFTSAITAAFGVGGGALLLVIMASFYPPSALIPIHGLIQLGSNVGRGLLMYKSINWQVAGMYVVGTGVGVVIGSQVFVNLSDRILGFILACFILLFTWLPAKEAEKKMHGPAFLAGAVAGFLTLFVGATGLLNAAFLARYKNLTKYTKVATFAVCMSSQHLFKVIAFAMMGFIFAPYAFFIVCMVAVGFVGTWVGKTHLLDRMDEKIFNKIFKIVVTVLAIKLIVELFI